MSCPLPEPTDTSHLAPCARCGTLNGLSARWCWRCDAALAADGPYLPQTVPPAVFIDPPLDAGAPDPGELPPRRGLAHDDDDADEGVIPRLGRLRSGGFDPTQPPVLTHALTSWSGEPSAASEPAREQAPTPAEPGSTWSRRYGIVALAAVVLVAVGVVAYVQMHEPRLADLNQLPPTGAGPVAAAPAPIPSTPPAPPAAAADPAPAADATAAAEPARSAAPSLPALAAAPAPNPPVVVKQSQAAAGRFAPAPAPRPEARRASASYRSTPVPLAQPRAQAAAPSRMPREQPQPQPVPAPAPAIAGPCTANAAALGLCVAPSTPN